MKETQEIHVRARIGKIPWRRKWQLTPVFLPEKFYGQRSLVDYSPWGRKELDTTEHTAHTHILYSHWLGAGPTGCALIWVKQIISAKGDSPERGATLNH